MMTSPFVLQLRLRMTDEASAALAICETWINAGEVRMSRVSDGEIVVHTACGLWRASRTRYGAQLTSPRFDGPDWSIAETLKVLRRRAWTFELLRDTAVLDENGIALAPAASEAVLEACVEEGTHE